jgi:hypothetical protein
VHAGLLGAWLAECHGAEDDVEGWDFGAGHFGLNLVFPFWDWDLNLSEMCGLSAWITTLFLGVARDLGGGALQAVLEPVNWF